MATENAKIIISAEDRTKVAFNSIKGNLTTVAGLLGGIGVGAFALAVKQAADFNDEMGKAAQKVGVTTRELSALKYAGDLSGVSFEGLQTGLRRLNTTLFDAAEGGKQASDSFSAVGINIRDSAGNLKGADAVLKELADRFKDMPDGANKTALAVRLLGKSGADLIPLLNQGSSGLRDMANEAQAFGQIVDDEAAKAAEQFNDNLTRLQKSFDGFKREAATKMLPALVEITGAMTEAAKEGGLLYTAWVGLGGLFANEFGLDMRSQARRDLEYVNRELAKQIKLVLELNRSGADVSKNAEAYKRLAEILAMEKRAKFTLGIDTQDQKKTSAPAKSNEENPPQNPKKTSVDRDAMAAQRFVERLKEQAATLGMTREEIQRYEASQIKLTDAQRANVNAMLEQIEAHQRINAEREAWAEFDDRARRHSQEELLALEEYSAAEEARKDSLEKQAQSIREMLDPSIVLMNTISEIQFLASEGYIDPDEEVAAIKKVTDEFNQMGEKLKDNKSYMADLGATFSSAFEDAVISGKKFSDILKGIEQDILRILLRKTVTDPFAQGLETLGGSFFNGLFNANGNAFDASGLVPFASGGVVNRATPFMFANGGRLGVMGEAGPEAILPLSRGRNGKLGVQAEVGGGAPVTVNVNLIESPGNGGQVSQRQDESGLTIDVMVEKIENMMGRNISRGSGLAPVIERRYALNRAGGN